MLVSTKYAVSKEVQYDEIRENLAISFSEEILMLSDVASDIFRLCLNPSNLEDIVEFLCNKYDVLYDKCRDDVTSFIEQLQAKGIIISINC